MSLGKIFGTMLFGAVGGSLVGNGRSSTANKNAVLASGQRRQAKTQGMGDNWTKLRRPSAKGYISYN